MTQSHRCDVTTELDCEDGDVESTDTGSTSRMNFQLQPTSTPQLASVVVKCAASNPCAPTSRLFGDIDYHGTIAIDPIARKVSFAGMIDQFPAFEAYVAVNDGAAVTLFRESPPAGNTVMNLPGNANRRITKTVNLP